MQSETENAAAFNTKRKYARLAGFLFLTEIILALGSGVILDHIGGSGTFTEIGRRISASEHLYRAGLSIVLIVTLSSAVLAFALYATLHDINRLLAQLALIFSLGDSFLAMVVRMCSFVRVQLYVSAQSGVGAINAEAFSNLMRNIAGTTENIGGISFGIGSLLFFYLFFQSKYIPRVLSGLGVGASAIWGCLYFAALVFPEHHPLFLRICFPPLALADVTTGLYLILFAVRTGAPDNQATQRASIAQD